MAVIETYSAQRQYQGSKLRPENVTGEMLNPLAGLDKAGEALSDFSQKMIEAEKQKEKIDLAHQFSVVEMDWMQKEQELKAKFGSDPDYVNIATKEFDNALKGVKQGKYTSGEYTIMADALKEKVVKSAANTYYANVQSETKNKLENMLTNYSNVVRRDPSAFNLNLAMVSEVANSSSLEPATKTEFINTATNKMLYARAEGEAERNPYSFITRYNKGEFDNVPNADNLFERAKNASEKQNSEVKHNLRSELTDLQLAARNGIYVDKTVLSSLEKRASSLGMEKEAEAIKEFAGVQDSLTMFSRMSFREQEAKLKALEQEVSKGDLGKASEYATLKGAYSDKVSQVKNNPWAFYSSKGLVDAPTPINFTDKTSVLAEVEKRRTGAKAIEAKEGFAPPILSKEDYDALKQVVDKGTPQQIAAMFTNLNDDKNGVLTREERHDIGKLFSKEDAAIGAMMASDAKTSEKIAQGLRIENVAVSRELVKSTILSQVAPYVADPRVLNQQVDGIFAYYKTELLRKGKLGDVSVDDEALQNAVDNVLGKQGSFAFTWGKKSNIILFKKEDGTEASEDEVFKAVKKASVKDFGTTTNGFPVIGGKAVDWNSIRTNGKFVSIGDGKLGVVFENNGLLVTNTGEPFTIDMRKMLK